MKVIAVLNQKGGAGKTTIATNLARAIQLRNYEILLVDADPQGSSRDWAAAQEGQPIPVVGIDRPTIDRDLKKLAKTDFVVIDGAPQTHSLTVSAMKAADFVLIPVQPSPYDIWATSDLVDLIKQRIEITNGALQAAFVVSRAIKGTKLGKEIGQVLKEYELPVLNTNIVQRVIYPNSASKGSTVLDTEPTSEAAEEINNLTTEILSLLN